MTRHVEVNAPMQRRERWGALACARGERPGPGDHTKTNTRARRPRSTNVAKQVEEGPSDKREKNPQTQPLLKLSTTELTAPLQDILLAKLNAYTRRRNRANV